MYLKYIQYPLFPSVADYHIIFEKSKQVQDDKLHMVMELKFSFLC